MPTMSSGRGTKCWACGASPPPAERAVGAVRALPTVASVDPAAKRVDQSVRAFLALEALLGIEGGHSDEQESRRTRAQDVDPSRCVELPDLAVST
eukprot:3252158-Rhodomonas_salina.1